MTEREENAKDYRIRPLITEEYNDDNKYDGKAQHYHGWQKAMVMKIKKSGNGDIITKDFYEIEKPEEEIKMIKSKLDEQGKAITPKRMEMLRTTVRIWMEQAATVKKGALTVMGLIEETITTEGWMQTAYIQEDDRITERERANKIMKHFKDKNDKYNSKGVEEAETKLTTMGACKTRRDVEMMIVQVETIQTTLTKIPVAFILDTSGNKIKQQHKKTDKAMNTHILERLPQKAMWENLRAEVAARDSDTIKGAYSTKELSTRITEYIDTYVMSYTDRQEEERDNKEADKEPQKRRKIKETGKSYEKEEKPKQINTTQKQTSQQTRTTKDERSEKDCFHYRYNNCKNGSDCAFRHDKGNQMTRPKDSKKAAGGKTKVVNTTKRKKENEEIYYCDNSEEEGNEKKKTKKKKKMTKKEDEKIQDAIEEMQEKIRRLKKAQQATDDSSEEEYMTE